MKQFTKKISISMLISFFVICVLLVVPVQASTQSAVTVVMQYLTGILDGLIGVMTWVYRLPVIAIVVAVLSLMSAIAGIFGYVDVNGNVMSGGIGIENTGFLGPDDIFFNKLLLTDANVFKIDPNMNANIIQIRQSIALWYYIMRVIAVVVLLGILIYIAIRMAMSTVASEKASYKKMLINWASSIVLVFLLHYLIVGIAYINSTLINILNGIYTNLNNTAPDGLDNAIGDLIIRSLDSSFIVSVTSMAVVVILIVQTFTFLIFYIKRMLTISFLIIISPLITITYSIDKLGDGKAQALNTWMKEYFFTVIIQPFHCIIYMVFVSMAMSILAGSGNLNMAGSSMATSIFSSGASNLIAGLLSIFFIKFIWDAEKMFKNIFGIKVSDTLGDAVMSAAVAGTMVSKGLNMASKAKTGTKALKYSFNKSKNGIGALSDKVRDGKIGKFFNMDSSEVAKKKAEEKKDRKFAAKNNMDYNRIKAENGEEGIREIHKRRLDAAKARQENSISNRIRNSAAAKSISGFMKSEGGMQFKRNLSTASGVAAAIIGGAATYGASAKTSLFEAGIAGYGSYKGIKSMTDRLLNAKKENYVDNVSKSQNTMAQIKGLPNTGDREDAARIHLDATRKDKEGDLSNTKIGDKEKEARKNIRKLLTARDHMDKGDKNPEIDQIISDVQNGIFLNNLDMDEIAKKYNLQSLTGNLGDDLRGAVGEFAELKLYKQMAQDNQDLDDLMGQDGFYKIALQAWAGDAAYQLAQSPVVGEIETTVDAQTKVYNEEIQESHKMMNEIKNVTTERTDEVFKHIMQDQVSATEAMKNGELASDKLEQKYQEAMNNLSNLYKAQGGMNDDEIVKHVESVMKSVLSELSNRKLDLSSISVQSNLKPDEIRVAVEGYVEKVIMKQMSMSNDNMDIVLEKNGHTGTFEDILAELNK